MNKPLNTILILMLIATVTVGCQSTHNNSTQKSETMTNTQKPVRDFDQQIEGKYWKLIELEGETVLMAKNQEREIHFKLNATENKINGFAGCNNFFGTYELEEDKMRIKFSQLASTMMACPDAEAKFDAASVASVVGKYTLSQGADKTPMLVVTNDHQVAHFKAVAKVK